MIKLYVVLVCVTSIQTVACGYFYSNGDTRTWAQAKDECSSKDMELARIDSDADRQAIEAYIKGVLGGGNVPYDLWIGLKYDMTSSPYVYRWINCEEPVYTNWASGEPNSQTTDLCIRITKGNFEFRTIECSRNYDYICTDPSLPYVYRHSSRVISRYRESVTLECPYCSSTPILTVEWKFASNAAYNTINIAGNSDKYSGSTLSSMSLTIMNVSDSDIGLYKCQVSNRIGSDVGLPIEFDIEDIPTVVTPILTYNVSYGNHMTLVCDVRGKPAVTSVFWTFQNATNTIISNNLLTIYGSSGLNLLASYDFEIHNAMFQNGGSYTCSATNSFGTAHGQAITVEVFGVKVAIPSSYYTAIYGESITLECDIVSNPSLQDVTWSRIINGTSVEIGLEDTSKYQGGTPPQPSLTIVDTNLTDQGIYYCHGNNSIHYGYSSTNLTVIGGVPEITVNQSLLFVNASDAVTLFCTVQGIPTATSVYWTKDVDGTTFRIYNNTQPSMHWSYLELTSVARSDAANYTCNAVNAEGTASSSKIQLQVIEIIALCPCRCDYKAKMEYWATHLNNYSYEEWRTILAPVVKEIRKNLSVNVESLTMTKLKYTSANDKRSSSASIGIVGIAFIAFIFLCIILIDVSSFVSYLKTRS